MAERLRGAGAIDTCGSIKIKKITDPARCHADVLLHVEDVTGPRSPEFQLPDGQTADARASSTRATITSVRGGGDAGWTFDSVTVRRVGDNLVQKSGANLTITGWLRSGRWNAPT